MTIDVLFSGNSHTYLNYMPQMLLALVSAEDPDFDLHHQDDRHANPIGSYLTACVFYSVLSNTSPEGLPGTFCFKGKKRVDLEKDKALLLQKVAWETVRNAE